MGRRDHPSEELRAQCVGGPWCGEWHPVSGAELHVAPSISWGLVDANRVVTTHVYRVELMKKPGSDMQRYVWRYVGERV